MAGDVNVNISNDALGLSEPLKKLVETVGQGAGVMGNSVFKFDVKKIKRISKAEADAERLKIINRAEAEGEAMLVLARASQRLQLEQYNKQVNLENLLAKTKAALEKDNVVVSDKPVDPDWSAKLIDVGQDVSNDDIQNILADIFKQELVAPGSSGKRLLEFLRSTDKSEIEVFANFASISSNVGLYGLGSFNNESLRKYDISVDDLRNLADIGLVTFEKQLSMPVNLTANTPQYIVYRKEVISIINQEDRRIEIPIMPLSKLGMQLYDHMEPYANAALHKKYVTDFLYYLKSRNVKAELNLIQ